MDQTQDVERLFSWFKAPMVHYREFAPRTEISEAVAAWPVLHKAAVETGVSSPDEPAPHGDQAAHDRVARERRVMPDVAAQAIRESPLFASVAAAAAPAPPAAQGQTPASAAAPARPVEMAPPPPPAAVEPALMSFDEPAAAPMAAGEAEPIPVPPPPPAGQRGALFAGEYRGRDREARPSHPVADRQSRSLDAVFSRLSGTRHGLPDPRARSRTTPGLGTVFERLR